MSTPLQGRTILITRSRAQASAFRKLLEDAGAEVLEVPTIEIRPRYGPKLDAAIDRLSDYDWLIFTSANGVEVFFERAEAMEKPTGSGRQASMPKICAIGPATAGRIEDCGYSVDLVPDVYQAEGILDEFLKLTGEGIGGLQVLLPRASQARRILPRILREKGAQVDVIPVYDTVVPTEGQASLQKALESQSPDLVTFTSSSTVRNFISLVEQEGALDRFRCAAIGPITAATAREHGLEVVLQSPKSSIPDFVEAITRYFRSS